MTNILSQSEVAEIRERAAKATPGPWRLCKGQEYPWLLGDIEAKRGEDTLTIIGGKGYGVLSIPASMGAPPQDRIDFTFAAASRTDVPALCDTVDALRAMLKAAIEGLRAYAGCCDGCTCGDGWSHDAARETLADINALAAKGSQ